MTHHLLVRRTLEYPRHPLIQVKKQLMLAAKLVNILSSSSIVAEYILVAFSVHTCMYYLGMYDKMCFYAVRYRTTVAICACA